MISFKQFCEARIKYHEYENLSLYSFVHAIVNSHLEVPFGLHCAECANHIFHNEDATQVINLVKDFVDDPTLAKRNELLAIGINDRYYEYLARLAVTDDSSIVESDLYNLIRQAAWDIAFHLPSTVDTWVIYPNTINEFIHYGRMFLHSRTASLEAEPNEFDKSDLQHINGFLNMPNPTDNDIFGILLLIHDKMSVENFLSFIHNFTNRTESLEKLSETIANDPHTLPLFKNTLRNLFRYELTGLLT